ncbi:hypothetical protein BGX24_009828 [Mortierella sp. AD032]|nr:hypothetical protein BGX24_009828 [Mortierella sp. AD032]
MITTKLRFLLAYLSLLCLAWNVDACNRVKGWGRLYNFYAHPIISAIVQGPVSRIMEFHLDFDGEKCKFLKDFGAGDYMMEWTGASDDSRCIVHVDLKKNQIMVRLDGLIFGGRNVPSVIEEWPHTSLVQQLFYDIDYSKNC